MGSVRRKLLNHLKRGKKGLARENLKRHFSRCNGKATANPKSKKAPPKRASKMYYVFRRPLTVDR